MEIYDSVISFKFSQTRDCYQIKKDQRLFERFEVPKFSDEIISCPSQYLHEISRVFEEDNNKIAMVQFDINRNLEFIILKNRPIEEMYIALIFRMTIELILSIHSQGLSGINFNISNFTLAQNSKLKLRNRFTLAGNLNKQEEDWLNFFVFMQQITPIYKTDDSYVSISRNFKEFIKVLKEMRDSQENVTIKLSSLLEMKFLNYKNNILHDLVDDISYLEQSEIQKIVSFEIKSMKEVVKLEKSGNPVNLGLDYHRNSGDVDDLVKQAKLLEIISNKFDKYRKQEDLKGKTNVVNLLNVIENSLKSMEDSNRFSCLKFMNEYLDNCN